MPRLPLALALLPLLAALPLCAQNQSGMVPFTLDHRAAILAPSPVDVSFLLDAPAGNHGFLRIQNGHLTTADNHRIRLWGVNITDWSPGSQQIPTKADAPFIASTLARFGINAVRLQFLDLPAPRGLIAPAADTRTLDPTQLDREDFFLAELKKRGIYADLNLLVGRQFTAADGVHDPTLLTGGAKVTSLYDARQIELQREYAAQLLTHLNPYTHLRWADDPELAIVEINNENVFYVGYHAPSAFYQDELTQLYNTWLSTHLPAGQISKLRTLAAVPPTAPVPLFSAQQQAHAQPPRFYAEAAFYLDIQRTYFADMQQYLKQTLGYKSLVIGTADFKHTATPYPNLLSTYPMDIIDSHDYWQHSEEAVPKSPMVNDALHSTPVRLSRGAIAAKPFMVSETNEPFPNDFAAENIPILAAYAALQDWDAVFWYTFEPKPSPTAQPLIGDAFDLSFDPIKMPELASGALLFLRSDVAPARELTTRSLDPKQVFDSILLPWSERPYFTLGFPLTLPLQHEVRIAPTSPPPPKPPRIKPHPILSDTHELAWYTWPTSSGEVTIDTPRSQGLIGFVKAQHKSLSNLTVSVGNDFAAILLSSLDDQPIATSTHLLLVAAARTQNTGQIWKPDHSDLSNYGHAPTLIEPVRATLTLHNLTPAKSITLQPLGGDGQPLGSPVPATPKGPDWTVSLSAQTTWYQLTVLR
jgi:hypothetical protein